MSSAGNHFPFRSSFWLCYSAQVETEHLTKGHQVIARSELPITNGVCLNYLAVRLSLSSSNLSSNGHGL